MSLPTSFISVILAALMVGFTGHAHAEDSLKAQKVSLAAAPDKMSFHQEIEALAMGDDFIGLAYAIVRADAPTQIQTYGVKQLGTTDRIDRDTRFRIASLSKAFAGTIAAELMQEERLDLNAPLSQYRPDFRLKTAAASNIRIEQILTHRMGLPPNAYDNLLEAGTPVATIERKLAGVKPICTPGTCYGYQNVTYDLIVDVLEQIEGSPYAQILKRRIFDPLGMRHASLGKAALEADNNWARPHRRRRGEAWRKIDVKPNYYLLPAAAGVNASIADMAQWLRAQLGHAPQALSAETLALSHAPRTNTLSETRRKARRMPGLTKTAYGLGWRIYNYDGETVITHSGAVAGYAASIAFIPERQTGIVLLSNTNTRSFHQIVPLFLEYEIKR